MRVPGASSPTCPISKRTYAMRLPATWKGSTPSFAWQPCQTIRSAISDLRSLMPSITAQARLAKAAKVERFLIASSCSNYGLAGDELGMQ